MCCNINTKENRLEVKITLKDNWLSAKIKPEIFLIKEIHLQLDPANKTVKFIYIIKYCPEENSLVTIPIEISKEQKENVELIKNHMLLLM